MLLGHQRRKVLQVAAVAGRLVDPRHGAAGERDPAAVGRGDFADRVQARHVRGETGDQHPVLEAADELHERRAHLGLGTRIAVDQRVGGIAHHGQHALVGERAQGPLVVAVADQGIGIQLPVAGVQDRAGRGPDHQRVGLGDGMGERDQLDLEGADGEAAGERHLDDLQRLGQAGLDQLRIDHLGGEGGGVDRAAQARPEVTNGADVVLVGVGKHQPDQILAPFLDEAGVGHEHVHARRAAVGKDDPEIDHEPAPSVAVEVQVHADLAGSAERQEVELVGPRRPGPGPSAHADALRLAR